jgi:hypothetical protein
MASINDQDAEIQAIALAWDVCHRAWTLFAVGTLEECQAACDDMQQKERKHGIEVKRIIHRVQVSI